MKELFVFRLWRRQILGPYWFELPLGAILDWLVLKLGGIIPSAQRSDTLE